jgi:hypothetical protein
MSINCEMILQWSARPEQLTSIGTGLWRWCTRAAGGRGIYQYLDNQSLADLIAGRFPTSAKAERRGLHLWFSDWVSCDRRATIDNMRREIPAQGIEDIVVDGVSWNTIEAVRKPREAVLR